MYVKLGFFSWISMVIGIVYLYVVLGVDLWDIFNCGYLYDDKLYELLVLFVGVEFL